MRRRRHEVEPSHQGLLDPTQGAYEAGYLLGLDDGPVQEELAQRVTATERVIQIIDGQPFITERTITIEETWTRKR
ncbi:hypothetical protein [Streptomyces sp. BBFR109]|uniref:hypothetical protein n=1 Tax=Streptomyces sp. BBFR109 TaxID=3448172 RepID=UPI003F759C3D